MRKEHGSKAALNSSVPISASDMPTFSVNLRH
jgi:hypothetical protein